MFYYIYVYLLLINESYFLIERLGHPLSLDVFENYMYWLSRDTGELIKQDKFGRGVRVLITKDLVNPSAVKGMYFKLNDFTQTYIVNGIFWFQFITNPDTTPRSIIHAKIPRVHICV